MHMCPDAVHMCRLHACAIVVVACGLCGWLCRWLHDDVCCVRMQCPECAAFSINRIWICGHFGSSRERFALKRLVRIIDGWLIESLSIPGELYRAVRAGSKGSSEGSKAKALYRDRG